MFNSHVIAVHCSRCRLEILVASTAYTTTSAVPSAVSEPRWLWGLSSRHQTLHSMPSNIAIRPTSAQPGPILPSAMVSLSRPYHIDFAYAVGNAFRKALNSGGFVEMSIKMTDNRLRRGSWHWGWASRKFIERGPDTKHNDRHDNRITPSPEAEQPRECARTLRTLATDDPAASARPTLHASRRPN